MREPVKKNKAFRRYMKSKLALTFMVITVALIALGGVLLQISGQKGEEYSKTVLAQQDYSSSVIPYKRGLILDRNKTILATSERVYNLILDPKVILDSDAKNADVTLDALIECFGYSREDLEKILSEKPDTSYVRYTRRMSEEERQKFLDYQTGFNKAAAEKGTAKIVGVWFESEYKRVYPYNNLACTVLGFSSSDSGRGNWGIEEYYNDELVGTNGREYGYLNSDGMLERQIKDATDGNTIVSTIDYTIQQAAEQCIQDFLAEYQADNVGVIVMNPNSGEILALATDKSYDLNNPTELSAYYTEEEMAAMTEEEQGTARAEIWKNFAVQDAYEPGSTAKPFTVAAGLEESLIHEGDTYVCEGKKVFGSGVYETPVSCNSTHNTVTLRESLMYSCNVAMMDIAAALQSDVFSKYQALFGFGKQTNVDLPGESPGLVYSENMGVTDLATNSFGQNYNVTMVQLASAFCSLVNGGSYYQPHIVKQILNSEGELVKNIDPILVRETVSASTCEFLKDALFETIENGTGKAAIIEGYSVGGKTGTAQKHPREDKKYLVSFVSFAPAENPEVLIYVIVDNPAMPEGEAPSASLAMGIEKKLMEAIIPYLNLPYSSEEEITSAPIPEATSASEAQTGEDGSIIPNSASASYDEVVPADGYFPDASETLPASEEGSSSSEDERDEDDPDAEP